MTAPERAWTASTSGKCHVGFDTPSLNYQIGWTRTDLIQPMIDKAVAEALERAADFLEREASFMSQHMMAQAIRAMKQEEQK